MGKRKPAAKTDSFYNFVRAALFDPTLARRMARADPGWLSRTSSNGESALAYVAIENCLEAVALLIDCGADVNTRDHFDETPLMQAAQLGYCEMVVLLLSNGADVHARSQDLETPLFKAARSGYAEICAALLAAGAAADVRNDLDESVWDVALPRKRAEVVAVLEQYGHREPSLPTS